VKLLVRLKRMMKKGWQGAIVICYGDKEMVTAAPKNATIDTEFVSLGDAPW